MVRKIRETPTKAEKDVYDYSAYVGVGHNHPDELATIVKLAQEQFELQCKVEKLEQDLEAAKGELKAYAERLLPDAMELAGMENYTTTAGVKVKVKEKIRGSLPKENQPKGMDWLEEKGYGGLIETQLVVPYSRGKLKEAKALEKELLGRQIIAAIERGVHHARLDGFIREQLAQGKEVPTDIFGIFRQRIAEVERK